MIFIIFNCLFSSDAMTNMLEDNYSSEEELKEIISSEKQRKRSGGGNAKDGKSQHRENARDHRIRHHPLSGSGLKLSATSSVNGGQIAAVCSSDSPILSASPSSGKMNLSNSRPSSGTGNKLLNITTSSTSATAAGE